MQKGNLIGFICAALFIHIMGPFLTSNNDLYFFAFLMGLFQKSSLLLFHLLGKGKYRGKEIPVINYFEMASINCGSILCCILDIFNYFEKE